MIAEKALNPSLSVKLWSNSSAAVLLREQSAAATSCVGFQNERPLIKSR